MMMMMMMLYDIFRIVYYLLYINLCYIYFLNVYMYVFFLYTHVHIHNAHAYTVLSKQTFILDQINHN